MSKPSLKRIVIIGPESTGKSTLCRQLARHYNTAWCPEYARAFLHSQGRTYSYADLLTIAKGQVALEEATATRASNFYFIDTDMYVMKTWCEVVFDACHSWILQQAAIRRYDLYLLCNTDLPWVADALREYPDPIFRQKLYKTYQDIVINSGVPWTSISGTNEERLQAAIKAIEEATPPPPEGGIQVHQLLV